MTLNNQRTAMKFMNNHQNNLSGLVSISKRKMINSWLVNYSSQDLKTKGNGIKRPLLFLNLPDQLEKENYNGSLISSFSTWTSTFHPRSPGDSKNLSLSAIVSKDDDL